jgi:hypothetical protein
MGIPRLSQDLLPYAERVTLHSSSQGSQQQNLDAISSLIIDGPSLVYYVYHKLLAYKSLSTPTLVVQIPTYREINETLRHFLSELEAEHNVEVQKLFFDGALPESKHGVRLERMDKLRQQLEAYRKVYPEFPPVSAFTTTALDSEKALWETPVMSTRKSTLPAPPFMVASAIESLRNGHFKDIVHVVPGEADIFCATMAKETGAAILTNDSDLAVHDLGATGRVVLLHSLEKQHGLGFSNGSGSIIAFALSPSHIAERMQVTSLLRFGFERFLDPSLSAAVMKERAKDDSRLETLHAEYDAFCEQYTVFPTTQLDELAPLDGLDPRTAEAVVTSDESADMYLTPVVEDPSRDSSWAYGASIRRLAYSLLLTLRGHSQLSKTVTEYARKGQRITSTLIHPTNETLLQEHLTIFLQTLDTLKPRLLSERNFGPATVVQWYILAFRRVCEQNVEADKPTPSMAQMTRLLGLQASKASPTSKIQWDDIHLLANMHAVLYSFRILQQLARHVLQNLKIKPSMMDVGISNTLRQLHSRLESMPAIENLFLDIPELRAKMAELDLETRNDALTNLTNLTSPGHHNGGTGTEKATLQQQNNTEQAADGEWMPGRSKRKRKRTSQVHPQINRTSSNMFDLLNGG